MNTNIPDPPFEGAAEARIVCAALQHKDTKEIVIGPRHYDKIMRDQFENFGGSEKWRVRVSNSSLKI